MTRNNRSRAELRAAYDSATRNIDPPCAIVDLDAFDMNLQDLTRRAEGLPIRVASKSLRCRTLLARALDHPGVRGVLAYSLREALWLHEHSASDDILVAYPTVDRSALARLAADDAARAHITLMVDSGEHLNFIEDVLNPGHPVIRVALELDVSWRPLKGLHLGARRSPIHTPGAAAALAATITSRTGYALVGVMGYEGQIAGVGDKDAGLKSLALRRIQSASALELAERRSAAVERVRAFADLEFVNGGGTGSVETTRQDPSVTEIAAGSGLVGPALFDHYTRFTPQPALLYALPVVRKPRHDIATLFAGGYLASGAADGSRLPVPWLPEGLRLGIMEGAGEVQTPVFGAGDLAIGDRVWMRHAKAGELAERFNEYHLVHSSSAALWRTVPTYRGEGVNWG
ncbi:amino acid deaminase/aldolase [Hoyosella subflava]|uniref:Predicted amino acid aldolase or racemase n=1 Tax=Hoyosella subflava (strain DSM 45089 / JCM 17490 / NBRC 109087 / DQS3-9A1) TaxID=443218 RepID=F6EHL5_HOYSD|nr:amino acid deaminase/aldolase [Hoyosella subflava]AEF42379.1 Predicted amino acid aldolase or racemase [Hoyosella subflava DQS3-9A1]